MKNPIKMDDLGGFPPIFGNTLMCFFCCFFSGLLQPMVETVSTVLCGKSREQLNSSLDYSCVLWVINQAFPIMKPI